MWRSNMETHWLIVVLLLSTGAADNENPVLICSSDGTENSDPGAATATVDYRNSISASDNSGDAPTISPDLESTFPATLGIGPTTFIFTATDSSGNTDTCAFIITVQDNELPVVTCPSNETYSTDNGQKYATVSWEAPMVPDNVDNNLQATCSPPSGSQLETSPFPITCSATDTAGNEGSCRFTVIIEDNEAPILTCSVNQDLPTDAGEKFATYDVAVNATDNVDNVVATTCMGLPAGNMFEIGVTNVSCSATDTNGNTGNCSYSVTVSDQEKPTFINCMDQAFNVLVDTDYKAVVNYTTPNATDNVKVVSGPVCTPASGSRFRKGSTPVTCNASDAANNVGQCLFSVTLINCAPGTYGPSCMGCTCVDNSLCMATTGNCSGCVDQILYGFECNFRDLSIEITATGLSILDGNVTQRIEEDVELICKYNLLNISGQWSKDGVMLVEFTGNTSRMSRPTIPSVGFNDSGTYTCTVNPLEYTDVISSVSKSVDVNVEVPPKFEITPGDQQGRLQDNLTFACSASGRPKVEITWLNNTGNAIRNTEGKYLISEIATEDNMIFTTNSTLVVYNISKDDNGTYECHVINKLVNMVDPLVHTFNITVQGTMVKLVAIVFCVIILVMSGAIGSRFAYVRILLAEHDWIEILTRLALRVRRRLYCQNTEEHTTGMETTDYDDVEVPTTTQNAPGKTSLLTSGHDAAAPQNAAGYEIPMLTMGDDDAAAPQNAPDNTGYEIPLQSVGDDDSAAPPKLESESMVDLDEDQHTYMSVEDPEYIELIE